MIDITPLDLAVGGVDRDQGMDRCEIQCVSDDERASLKRAFVAETDLAFFAQIARVGRRDLRQRRKSISVVVAVVGRPSRGRMGLVGHQSQDSNPTPEKRPHASPPATVRSFRLPDYKYREQKSSPACVAGGP